MTQTGIIGIILIISNLAFSYKGFKNQQFFDGYKFEVDRILINKDYKRLITSGFLHVNWTHLLFNMFSLFAFSSGLESLLGGAKFLLIYIVSLLGGDLLCLFIHKNHGDYSAVGASGAISGIIFASIALFPGLGIGLFGFPISIPAWLYGILYVLFSIYGIKSKKDNIGHEAHLGGALVGMVVAILIQPTALVENYLPISIIFVPTLAFIYFIFTRPQVLLIDNYFYKAKQDFYSIDHEYNSTKAQHQAQVDNILDKINKRGLSSLTAKEKEILKKFS